jgi:hypothetical protein
VPLSSAPVQLLNLSVSQLQKLATQQGLAPAAGAKKIELIRLLVKNLQPATLETAAEDYLYAGKTSVAWTQFTDGPVTLDVLKKAIITICGADPFASNLKPTLGSTPKLLRALAWHNDKVVLTFAVRGNERLVFQGYQLREVSEDISLQAVFRLKDAVLEIRSAHLYVQRLEDFVGQLAGAMGRNASPLAVTRAEFDALRVALAASLVDYTGLDASPSPYRTRSVTKKRTCPDLAVEPAFQQEYGGLDAIKGDIVFVGADGEDVSALVAIRTSSVYFRSAASEATIDMVYAALRVAWP